MPAPHSDAGVAAAYDLSNIPRDYLEAYPFPALVLLLHCPLSSPSSSHPLHQTWTPIEPFTLTEPFRPIWSNEPWARVAGKRAFLNCITVNDSRRLGDWLTGVASYCVRKRLAESWAAHGDDIAAEARSSERMDPVARQLASKRGSPPYGREKEGEYAPLSALALEGDLVDNVGTITVEFSFPRGKAELELILSRLPLLEKSGMPSSTNSLAVITAVPRSNFALFQHCAAAAASNADMSGATSSVGSPLIQSLVSRRVAPHTQPRNRGDKLFNGHSVTHNWVSGNPIYINHDGTVLPQPPLIETVHESGLPLDVRSLLWSKDWSQTPLGPMEQWPSTLRMIMTLCMGFPTRVCVWWGRDLTMLYNEGFARIYSKHPQGYGTSGPEAWSELWSMLGSLTEVLLSGTSIYKDDDLYFYRDVDSGRTYETYRSGVWSPVMNDDGEFGGIWHAIRDTTARVIADRRSALLRDLADRMSASRTLHSFESGLLETLDANPKEAPFCLLYFVDQHRNLQLREQSDDRLRLRYAGGIGIPDGHPSAPEVITLERGKINDEPWPLAEALSTHRTILVKDIGELIRGYTARVWDELPSSAVVIPLVLNSEQRLPGAVLVLGLSCRLEYDASYVAFIQEFRFQIASYLSAVRLYQADQQRIDDLASLDSAKSALLSNVSNELFTPITLISGPLDDLLAEMSEGPQLNMVQTARRNVRRLARMVEMIMDLSRLENGRLKGSFRRHNLGRVTGGVAGLFQKPATKNAITYLVECDDRQMDTFVDPEHWEKILFVLIGSAIKRFAGRSVLVKLEYTETRAVLTVGDTAGLDGSSLLPNVDDANIALAFARKLVELQGGLFSVSRGADGGFTFCVQLPLGSAHLAADALAADQDVGPGIAEVFGHEVIEDLKWWQKEEADPSSSSQSGDSVPNARGVDPSTVYFSKDDVIMVVDDIPDSRRYIASILEPYCTIVEARDGRDALEKFSARVPDLVIADAVLPILDGPGLIAELRAGTKDQRLVPTLVLTAADVARDIGALRADDTLSKPFNARELIARADMQMQLGKKRRALEQMFEERTMELRLLTEGTPVGMYRCGPDGNLLYANAAWHEMSGYPVSEHAKFHIDWGEYLDESFHGYVRTEWARFAKSGEDSMDLEFRWKNGRWCNVKVLRLKDVGTDVGAGTAGRGFIGCAVDVTERKLNEEMQRQRIEEAEHRRADAEEARQQQELLIDITSHEIRNPISSLMQCAALVKTNLVFLREEFAAALEGETTRPFVPTKQLVLTLDEDLEALDSIYHCGLAQERISNDVLSLGKIQLDLLEMFDVAIDIRNEAQKVVSIFQHEARMNRIALQLVVSPAFEDLGLETVMTDPVRLGQVVTNLLSNATRFTANSTERRVQLHLDVGLEPPLDDSCVKPEPIARRPTIIEDMPVYLYIAVSDTGPGLTEMELSNLFQRFSQASPMTHTVFGGSGLGLFVCRMIVERMGGKIEVVSEYGKGSTFKFYVQCKADKLKVNPPPVLPTSPLRGNSRSLNGGRPRVLIVEDNVINRTVLLRQLKHVGLRTDSASNGLEGFEKVRAAMGADAQVEPYDCVLMDLEMPVMDGYTAARAVREEEAVGRLRASNIVALTGNARQAQIEAAMADFDDVVIKPYRLDDLLNTMEDVMKGRKGMRVGAGGLL